MQQRWTQLKEELEMIRELRDKSQKKGAPRAAFVSILNCLQKGIANYFTMS